MRSGRGWWCLGLAVAALVGLAGAAVAARAVQVADGLVLPVPDTWRIAPAVSRNLIELTRAASAEPNALEAVRVALTTETRRDHAAAVDRLQEIAAEWGGQRSYLSLCGWPALERRAVVELAHLADRRADRGADDEKATKPFDPRRITTTVVTVAVAANQRIVRFEGTLAPDGPASAADQVVLLAGGLQCAPQPPPGQTAREVAALDATLSGPLTGPQGLPAALFAPEPDSEPASAPEDAPLQAPGLVQGGVGELQIAVSNGGAKVLVAANSGNSLSTDGGLTYTLNPAIPWGFRVDGDPSVGVGVSGNFYFATIGIPKASSPAPCTDSVAVSLDGQSFTFVGNAVSCPFAASNNCFPDQEQMAVDRKNAASGGKDQLYMVWRNFPPQGNSTCINIKTGNPTPTLSCSKNSGQTWGSQTAVGSGDVGRVAVGGDGFVYVTYVSGSNLMINKFSSCDSGLNQQAGFPVTIATLNGVNCPVPGLDRCNNAGDASPQAAVSDTKVKQVFVAYADNVNGNGNESIVVRQSLNGGQTWPNKVNVNGGTTARRFLPWICVSKGTPYVTWYDRGSATAAAPDRTAYFVNFLTPTGNSMTAGKARSASQVSDPQCATGWPCSLDNQNDATGCPATTSQIAGACLNGSGGGSGTPCNFNGGSCPSGESCQPGGGCPKYGDYNGNACSNGGVYLAWASATPPPGVVGAPAGINVYTDHLNFGRCGKANLPCCLQGAVCGGDATLACNASGNCAPCGDVTGPCCATGAQCKGTAVCNAQNVCSCGALGEPCCGAGATCQNAALICDITGKCACGGVNQPCCEPGLTCDADNLVCDHTTFNCITNCGHQGQPCCNGTSCNAGLACAGGVCACGGVNQPCCFPSSTCNATLSCTNGHCFPAASQCASCKTNLQLCLAKCGSDAHCQCLCHNSDCSCLLNGSCGICTFQNCGQ